MEQKLKHSSPLVMEFLRALGQSDVRRGIEHAANIASSAGAQSADFVDLEGAAARFGVRRVRYEEIPCEGMLIPRGNEYEIVISASAPPNRQRFSLAHELAHIVLHKLVPETRGFATRSVFMPPGHAIEERLCDAIAGAMLMPRDRVVAMFANCRVSVELLRSIAAHFRVSVATATLRTGEMVGKRLGLWQFVARPAEGDAIFHRCIIRGASRLQPTASQVFGAPSMLAHAAALGRVHSGWEWIPRGLTKSRLFLVTEPSKPTSHNRPMLVITSTQDISADSLQLN